MLSWGDAKALNSAVQLAKAAGITGPGVEAADRALEALGGKDAVGPEEIGSKNIQRGYKLFVFGSWI